MLEVTPKPIETCVTSILILNPLFRFLTLIRIGAQNFIHILMCP